jgi:hypothetical protein
LGTFVQGVTGAISVALTVTSAGCGGGATAVTQQIQAQVADFSVAVSSSSVTISQGGVSAPVNFSIVPRNGFSGSVQVSFTGVPVGVSSNPVSPFTITSGSEAAVNFGADATASTGSFTSSAQAVSGALSHSASLTLAIQASSAAAFPRSNFVRTDSTPLADNPLGEVHHRHIAYDPAHKYEFIANAAMNRLEVISAVDVDGTTVFAGTGLNGIVAVDTTALQVKARYQQAGLSPIPATVFDRRWRSFLFPLVNVSFVFVKRVRLRLCSLCGTGVQYDE